MASPNGTGEVGVDGHIRAQSGRSVQLEPSPWAGLAQICILLAAGVMGCHHDRVVALWCDALAEEAVRQEGRRGIAPLALCHTFFCISSILSSLGTYRSRTLLRRLVAKDTGVDRQALHIGRLLVMLFGR